MSEEKEYMTLQEAAAYTGMKRSSLYNYMEKLGIEPEHFPVNPRRAYLATADVKRIKQLKDEPWKLEEETAKQKAIKKEQG